MKISIPLKQAILLLAVSAPTCCAQEGFLEDMLGTFGVSSRNETAGDKAALEVRAKDCRGPKCTIDTSALDVNENVDSISFGLKDGGRAIKCNKVASDSNPTGISTGSSWLGRCDGDGAATLIQRGTNSKGEKLLYGSLVDLDTKEICRFSPDVEGNNEAICIPAADFPDEADVNTAIEEEDVVIIDDDGRLRKLVADPDRQDSLFRPQDLWFEGLCSIPHHG